MYQYDLLRIILVTLVVLGHSSNFTIQTRFGSIEYGLLLKEAGLDDSIFHKVVTLLTSWIYSFHMPLFITLSGTIYGINEKSDRYREFKQFLYAKVKRLLVPFVIVWWLYRFPIMYFTGFYEGAEIKELLLQMVMPHCVYLWYLESLFIIFVIVYVLEKIKHKFIEFGVVIALYLVGVYLYFNFSTYHFGGDPFYYLLWFFLGMHSKEILTWLEDKCGLNVKKSIILFLGQVCVFLIALFYILSDLLTIGLNVLVYPILMFVVLYYFTEHYEIKNKRIIQVLSTYCMGIYLYAEPLNYLLLYLFYRLFGISVFASEIGSVALWMLRLFLTPAAAICITWILKRFNVKYLY